MKTAFLKAGWLIAILFLFMGLNAQNISAKKTKLKTENAREKERERERERKHEGKEEGEDENDEYDGPGIAAEFEFNKTKDPVTGTVPKERLLISIEKTRQSKIELGKKGDNINRKMAMATWTERGPYADATGPSNGNTRANSGIASGRVRAVMVDSADATKKTVWIGGVNGGLWKTSDITTAPATWVLVNDYLSNLAVTDICQDPTNSNTMYFCTGEAYFNADAVKGNGVFKSTDHGITWSQLSSTGSYGYCTRILCDYLGNVYLATRGSGLVRSTDGGSSWTNITPTGLSVNICDLEISSTSAAARLHVVAGIFSTQAYRYTDIASTATTSTGWNAPTTAFPSYAQRAEITCSGSVLYALPADATYQVPTIYKSTDGGANWAATAGQPASGWASGQGWYALAAGINPANNNQCIVGGLDTYKTTDGGTTWTKISAWVGTTGQYVHADVHKISWFDNGNKLLFGCDGGIHYSADGGTTIRDRNSGLRIKQFYSCAIHPTSTNYFLAGAQDNGTHQLNAAGLASSVEVTGGDGAFVAIDQNEPLFQFGSYVYNTYRRSTNGGTGWSSINFYKGTSAAASNFGSFINAYDYDNSGNAIYAGADAGEYFRWTTPQTTTAGTYYAGTGFPTGAAILTGITALNASKISTVKVSPFTANRVYFGTAGGRVVYLDNANTAASGAAGTNITASGMAGSVSCINVGTNDQNLIASFSNYGVSNVWVSTDGGGTWAAVDGNLPDMPVRWCMLYPGDNTKAIIATETGVWTTDLLSGATTVWSASASFPVVRTDMIKYRSLDGTLLAATHGRGLFTTILTGCTLAAPTGSGASICGTGTVTLSATPPVGETIDWYAASSGGAALSSGATSFTTPSLSATTTYYAESRSSTTAGCISPTRTAVVATVTAIPLPPGASGTTICGPGTATLSATAPAGTSIAWYSAASGGAALATSASYTTPVISTDTTYYAEATLNGCISPTRTAVTATVNAVPDAPTVTGASRCGTGTVILSATAPAGATLAWYSAASGGTALATTGTYTTPVISASTTYYVQSVLSGCASATRTAVTATVLPAPAAPTGTAAAICGTGTVSISATPATGDAIDWYAASAGGTALLSGSNSFTTPVISANTTYYAEAVNTTSGCISATRTAVTATVNAIPAAPAATGTTICGTGTATLTATAPAGGTVAWYSASAGGTALSTATSFTTPSLSATTTYYVEAKITTSGCISATRTAVDATVTTAPAAPTASDVARCGTGTVTLTATPPAGATVAWFSVPSAGTALATTNSYTTASLTATTTYYVESRIGTTCTSASRTAVVASVGTVPAAPTGTAAAICGAGTATISATPAAGAAIDWYAASTGGTALLSGSNSFTTPSISATTTYYAEARNTTAGCISATRTAVIATVNAIPAAPTATGATRCGTGTLTLTATAPTGGTVAWYSTSAGGTALSTATSFTTPSLSTTTTYYVEAKTTTSGCVSATRTAVSATITTAPAAPTAPGVTRCGTGTVTLTATPPTSATVAWFSVASAGTALATTNTYTTASLTATTTYYVESRIGTTCISATRTAVVATIGAVPAAPTGIAGSRCGTGTVVISATPATGSTIDWYAVSTAGTVLTGGSGVTSFTTPSIAATTTYYAAARNITTGCVSATRTAVIATVNAIPAAPTATGATRCGTGTLTLTATAPTGGTVAWYSASAGGTALSTATSFTTPSISATTIYYVEAKITTSGCVSATRTAVTATISTAPAAPTAPGVTRCGSGTVTLTATPPTGATVAWFSVASAGTALATTNTYTTASLTATTTYYVESRIGTTCISATRTAVVATVAAVPAAPTGTAGSGCGTGPVVISATPATGSTIDWYAVSTAGTVLTGGTGVTSFTTPSIAATTTYYAAARNSTTGCVSATRTAVVATVNALLAAPASLTGLTSICPLVGTLTGTTYTTVAVTGAVTYAWTIPAGAVLDSGSTGLKIKIHFNTATANDSIYVQAKASTGCLGVKKVLKLTTTGCATLATPAITAPMQQPITAAKQALEVKVFPNPTSGEFQLEVNSGDATAINARLLDITGKAIKSFKINANKTNSLGKELKPGTYFLEVTQGKTLKTVKVMKF